MKFSCILSNGYKNRFKLFRVLSYGYENRFKFCRVSPKYQVTRVETRFDSMTTRTRVTISQVKNKNVTFNNTTQKNLTYYPRSVVVKIIAINHNIIAKLCTFFFFFKKWSITTHRRFDVFAFFFSNDLNVSWRVYYYVLFSVMSIVFRFFFVACPTRYQRSYRLFIFSVQYQYD